MEGESIRQVLEDFNIRTIKYNIGRPNDFIDFLSGADYIKSDFIIFSFNGDKGKFVMPVLGENIYEENEPTCNFGPEEIKEYFNLKDTFILNTGCTLGSSELAEAFLNKGCRTYIGATDYIDGNSPLFFVIRFFYELCTNKLDKKTAYELTKSTDNELGLFKWYSK